MNQEVLKELLEAVVTAIDLLGIDVRKEFPNLYSEMKQQARQHKDKGENK